MIVVKEPNHTIIELNDVERAFLFVVLEGWDKSLVREPVYGGSALLSNFAKYLAEELAP